MTEPRKAIRWWELALLVVILLAATVLRTWRLGNVPPGLTHDEAANGHDAAAILRGVRPLYFTVGYGHEPLYPYSVALVMALLGPTVLALRLTTVVWGLALILLSYTLSRRLFGVLTATLVAALMAVSFWCVMTSRVGLRAITSATMFAASAYAFWRAIPLSSLTPAAGGDDVMCGHPGRKWLWWGLSGVLLGASIYTYMASRAMPAVYVLFVGYLAATSVVRRRGADGRPAMSEEREESWKIRARKDWRAHLVGVVLLLLVAGMVAAPLAHYLMTHPEAERRLDQLSGPIRQAFQGDFGALWERASRSLPMFTIRGDPLWLYNIPGRPLLDVAIGAFFYAGVLVCLWRWRDPRYVFFLLWMVVGVGPALVTGPDATALRSITAQPATFQLTAIGLSVVIRFFHRRSERWGKVAVIGTVGMLLLTTTARTARAYFGVWGQHTNVRVAYHHALVEEAHYLDTQSEGGTVALSSIYPGRFHDPYTMEIALHREDLSLRWFDGRHSLVFPAAEDCRVIVPTIAPLDEALVPLFAPGASHMHTERFRPQDLINGLDVYRFRADDGLAALLPAIRENPVYWSPLDSFPLGDPTSRYETLGFPVNVGDSVNLIGYDLQTPTVKPGGEVVLLTVWRVRDSFRSGEGEPLHSELVAFSHVLGPDGRVVGQEDRLDVPCWHWQPGDAFVQLHRFAVEPDISPGRYSLEVGFYTRDELGRLLLIVDGDALDDRILLQPLEVTGG